MVPRRVRVPSFMHTYGDGPPVPVQSSLLSPSVLERVKQTLEAQGHVVMLYADVVRFHQAEQLLGPEGAERLLSLLPDALVQAVRMMLPDSTPLQVQHIWADDFVLYIDLPSPPPSDQWQSVAGQIARLAALAVNPQHSGPGVRVEIQAALRVLGRSDSSLRGQIARAVRLLQEQARPEYSAPENGVLLQELLDTGQGLSMVYQPIVAMQSGAIAGYEALCRGPVGTPLASPLALFDEARAHDQLFTLELACRRLAIAGAQGMDAGQMLFLNLEPQTIHAHDFVSGKTTAMLAAAGLSPSNVVIEVTERSSVGDFATFRAALDHYRQQGFRIAVDDAGAGYSSLQAISELRPDFIKVDRSLVTGAATSPIQLSLLRTLVAFARDVGSQVVAEGVETAADLATLRRLGVDYAQGYFLARPAFPRPELTPVARLELGRQAPPVGAAPAALTIRSLLAPAVTVLPDTPLLDLERLPEVNPQLAGAVTIKDGRPQGYLSWAQLWHHLSSPFARALAAQVPVADRHDHHPLLLGPETPLTEAARLAACRPPGQVNGDLLVVDEAGMLLGVVTVAALLAALSTDTPG